MPCSGTVASLALSCAHTHNSTHRKSPWTLLGGSWSQWGAQWVVAVGGSSATGLAKAVMQRATDGEGAPIRVAAIPTTYAGSEMTGILFSFATTALIRSDLSLSLSLFYLCIYLLSSSFPLSLSVETTCSLFLSLCHTSVLRETSVLYCSIAQLCSHHSAELLQTSSASPRATVASGQCGMQRCGRRWWPTCPR